MIKDFAPHIGKTVIETLTMGMYDNPLFIFREYIQNAADQIDIAVEEKILKGSLDGTISIKLHKAKGIIEVTDNATGISSKDVLRFLGDVANSEKDQAERKGFRGIGRLGGLGYCEKLTFKTTAKGENIQSTMTLDAKLLRAMLLDRNKKMDAATVISIITSVSQTKVSSELHFFTVIMESVTNPVLLEDSTVINYLSMVAPVPFNPQFKYSKEIIKWYSKNNFVFDEYNVDVNGKRIYKNYKDELLEEETVSKILGIEFFEVRAYSRKLLALGWLGYRDLSNKVLSDEITEKGIRLRKNNIQIGNELTLSKFFPMARTNLRFIGELHAIGPDFIPNARRDYFIDNSTCSMFENCLRQELKKGNYENIIAQNASKISTRIAAVEKYQKDQKHFDSKAGSFRSAAEERSQREKLKAARDIAEKAVRELSQLKDKAKKDHKIGTIYKSLTANKSLDIIPGINLSKNIYSPPFFKKLTDSETAVVREIFEILEQELEIDESEKIKKIIIQRYN